MSWVDVVTHVHWDREWYRTFDAFRARLVELVEAVLDQLDAGQLDSFLLDGQTCVVDDHLEIRPDHRERIAQHVGAGRLRIGPWYVLADKTLVSGESLIRNLSLGGRRAAALGGRTDVGYCPDMFGHPPELPMLLRGFGIDHALVWRGTDPRTPRFRWRSPDGSEVLTLRSRYYEPEVLWSAEGATRRLEDWLAARQVEQPDGPWLLLNGGDHLAPRDLADTIAGLDVDRTVRQTTLEEHLRAVERDPVPVVEGPLRQPGAEGAFLLAGTLSIRSRAKRANADAQALLEGLAEPLVAQAALTPEPHGEASERTTTRTLQGLLDEAWKQVLLSHPHDSVCGCATDTVAADTHRRYLSALEVGEQVVARAAARLGLPASPARTSDLERVHLAVLNPTGRPVGGGIRCRLAVPDGRIPTQLRDHDGNQLPLAVVPGGLREDLVTDVATPPTWPRTREVELHTTVTPVPPGGWTTLEVLLDAADAERLDGDGGVGWTTDTGTAIRGGRFRVEVEAGGTLCITDERTGRSLAGVGRLSDGGDRGDTYNHDAPLDDVTVAASLTTVRRRRSDAVEELHIGLAADLPAGLTDDRDARRADTVPLHATLVVRLTPAADQVELDLVHHNLADDHRLRFHVPTGGDTDRFVRDSAFTWQAHAVVDRPPELPDQPGYEADPGTQPVHRFLATGDGPDRVAVLVHGHHEATAEVGPDGTELVVTVLRSVGQLGYHDLRTRTMGAGPPVPTPDAQEHGEHRLRLALRLGDDDDQLTAAAWGWRTPLQAVPLAGPPTVPSQVGVEVDGACRSAWKPADDGDGWIVRVANPTPASREATVRLPVAGRVEPVRLDETPVVGSDDPETGVADVGAGQELAARAPFQVTLPPGGLASWRIRPQRPLLG